MLTEQDIAILIEAMGLWERKHSDEGLSKSLINIMTGKRVIDPDSGTTPELAQGREQDAQNAEVAILIKAKLVQMKRDALSRYDNDVRDGLVPDR